ncbi:MAG: tetratricopeptide repeat protein [Thermodesulfobacteriota bacterium]
MDKTELKIMVINRSQMLRTIIRDTLRKNGFWQVSSTDNGAAGLQLARADRPHLMIADYGLADMTGLDLLHEVRQDRFLERMAFILISSEPERKKVAAAAERRVNAYVVKPFSQQTLLEKVNLVLEQQINPAEGVACFREANHLAQEGNIDDALQLYRQALNATGYSMAAVYYKIGQALEKKERDDDAEANYHHAVERSHRYVAALDALGALHLKRNSHQEAAKYLRRGVAISPLNAERQLALGEVLFETGDFDGAEKAYKTSLELDPLKKTHVYNRLGITMRRLGDLEQARDYFQKALETAADEENLHFNLGQVYLDLGEKDKARRHLERALELNPGHLQAKNLLSMLNLTE